MISRKDAAEKLQVSTFTIKNWTKTGLLPDPLTAEALEELLCKIESGEVNRLKTRANKLASSRQIVPKEYIGGGENLKLLYAIIKLIRASTYSIEQSISLAASLYVENELRKDRRRANLSVLVEVLDTFSSDLPSLVTPFSCQLSRLFAELNRNGCFDALGSLYQTLMAESDKSAAGSYYTPIPIIDTMLDRMPRLEALEASLGHPPRIIDPCCGTGVFLLRALERGAAPDTLYGIDIDPIAVFIAKLNLLIHAPSFNEMPRIFCRDALSSNISPLRIGLFDWVITNPPWGAQPAPSLRKSVGAMVATDSFANFVSRSLEFLRPGGELHLLLPQSILNINQYECLRRKLLSATTLVEIADIGRVFSGVYSAAVTIYAVNTPAEPGHQIQICRKAHTHQIGQCRFAANSFAVFDIQSDPAEVALIGKIYDRPHITLKGNAAWALGIVTGDNVRHLLPSAQSGAEPIYKGIDIQPYRIGAPSAYIRYNPAILQQTPPDALLRAPEKLIYRFISRKLIFAYDNQRRLTLNSANTLIPSLPGYTLLVAMLLLNSSLFQFLFEKQFATHRILRSHLERLPFPILTKEEQDNLESLAQYVLHEKPDQSTIDQAVFTLFGLSAEEVSLIVG